MEHTEDEMIRCGEKDCKYRTREGGCAVNAEVKSAIKSAPPIGRRKFLYCDKYETKDGIWEYRDTIRRAIEE